VWGRKQRRIDEITAHATNLKSELARHLAQIIALDKALKEASAHDTEKAQILAAQSELIKELNAQIGQLTRALEREQADARKAEEAANAAIQAGGLLGDQLRAAQAAIAVKDDIADGLASKVEQLKADKAKLSEALGQARAELGQLRDGVVNAVESGRLDPRRGWGRNSLGETSARPQLEVVPEVPDRPEAGGSPGKSS